MPGNWGRGIMGPNIVLDGLVAYYDIANVKSYNGVGTAVTTLMPYPSSNATLYGGATYVSSFPQAIRFQAASSQYLRYDLANFGTSFTVMSIVSSATSIWTDYGALGGSFYISSPGAPMNGFGIDAFPDLSYGGTRVIYSISTMNTGTPTNVYVGDKIPSNITRPNIYYFSYNSNTNTAVYGVNSDITTTSVVSFTSAQRDSGYLPMFIGKNREILQNDRYMNMNVYTHMLYSRGLTREELLTNYGSLKFRFGLS